MNAAEVNALIERAEREPRGDVPAPTSNLIDELVEALGYLAGEDLRADANWERVQELEAELARLRASVAQYGQALALLAGDGA